MGYLRKRANEENEERLDIAGQPGGPKIVINEHNALSWLYYFAETMRDQLANITNCHWISDETSDNQKNIEVLESFAPEIISKLSAASDLLYEVERIYQELGNI